MPKIEDKLVITRRDILKGSTLKPGDSPRVIGFDSEGNVYTRRGYGSRLAFIGSGNPSSMGIYKDWKNRGQVTVPGGLHAVRAGLQDVSRIYNEHIANRTEGKEVFGEAASIDPQGQIRIRQDDIAIWSQMSSDERLRVFIEVEARNDESGYEGKFYMGIE